MALMIFGRARGGRAPFRRCEFPCVEHQCAAPLACVVYLDRSSKIGRWVGVRRACFEADRIWRLVFFKFNADCISEFVCRALWSEVTQESRECVVVSPGVSIGEITGIATSLYLANELVQFRRGQRLIAPDFFEQSLFDCQQPIYVLETVLEVVARQVQYYRETAYPELVSNTVAPAKT
jgi:hypothetical protein